MELSDNTYRKFIESIDISDYQVETDEGFVDIVAIHTTVPYVKYIIKTDDGLCLECADKHILFKIDHEEVYAEDIDVGDEIITENGISIVTHVENTGIMENMYDLELSENSDHRYYTNGILSHNTLIAKKLAENVFGDEKALIRFDMSEYQDKTSVNKLLGSSAGYVGYDNGGLLTEAVKNKPYCVLLFDEIEKADESIYNVFLQLFDEGRLTDNAVTTVNFKNVIVIMTSNVGAKQASEMGNSVGFADNKDDRKKSIVEKSLRNKFNPEFLNRIDKIIHFNSLTDENLKDITKLELNKLYKRVKENGVILDYDDSVVDYVYRKATNEKEYGARPIMRIIQDDISDKAVDMVLESDRKENEFKVEIDKNNEVVVSRK